MKNDLQAKAKTVRRDLFKRMSKHALSTNSGLTTVEMEAGEIPRTWEGFLEAGLRDKRWIDADAQPVCFGAPKAACCYVAATHYTLGKLKEGRRWPREWLAAEQASVVAALFREATQRVESPRNKTRSAKFKEGQARKARPSITRGTSLPKTQNKDPRDRIFIGSLRYGWGSAKFYCF